MIIRGFSLFSRLAAVIAMLFTLSACGGGGGSEGGFIPETNELQLSLFGPGGEPTNAISPTSPGTLEVRVKGDNKRGVVVSVSATLASVTPATALTDSTGVATFQINAGTERGAGTITATASVNDENVTGSLGFQVQPFELILSLLDPDGNATTSVSATKPGTLEVLIPGENNSGVLVQATANIGVLSPATALTNEQGIATFQLEAGDQRGGGSVRANANVDGESLSGSLSFQVGETGFRIGFFDDDDMFVEGGVKIEPQSTLAAGGSAQLSVVVLDRDGNLVTTVEEVIFS